MTFPIAVGTGPCHTSSRPFPPRARQQKGEENVSASAATIMTMGTNNDETLTATMFISYHYFIIPFPTDDGATAAHVGEDDAAQNNDTYVNSGSGRKDELGASNDEMGERNYYNTQYYHVIAEVRVQITPTTSPFTDTMDGMTSRETKSRVPLGTMRKKKQRIIPSKSTNDAAAAAAATTTTATYIPNASIEFSSNDAHLACLIPIPIDFEIVVPSSEVLPTTTTTTATATTPMISTIVIFRIETNSISSQKQMQHQRKNLLPPLPNYIIMEETTSTLGGSTNENELENNNDDSLKMIMIDNFERNENPTIIQQQKHPTLPVVSPGGGTAPRISSLHKRGEFVSYVAHEPRIVRTAQQLQHLSTRELEASLSNRTINIRKLSRGDSSGTTGESSNLTTTTTNQSSTTMNCGSCMCNVPSDRYRGKSISSSSSVLLVGTIEGQLLIVDYNLARVLRSVSPHKTSSSVTTIVSNTIIECDNNQQYVESTTKKSSSPIIHISQVPPTQWKSLDRYGEEQGSLSKGRVVTVLRDGSLNIYTTSFIPSLMNNIYNNDLIVSNANTSQKNKNRLEMNIHLLASYKASKLGLRYIRARWINPLVLCVLTRSPYLNDEHLCSSGQCLEQRSAAVIIPSEIVVAQIWRVAEVLGLDQNDAKSIENNSQFIASGWEMTVNANITLVSELKMPYGDDSINELIHDKFSLSQATLVPVVDDNHDNEFISNDEKKVLDFTECLRGMSILYHRPTDCLTINSQMVLCKSSSTSGFDLQVRPFCLIWDWKRNVPGLTMASCESYPFGDVVDKNNNHMQSLFSWFQLGDDEKYGLCAIHIYEEVRRGNNRRIMKKIFSLSSLSPRNKFGTDGCMTVNEPSAILLHRDSVTFPFLYKSGNTRDVSLKWEESRVPPTYVASNGPCKIAVMGKDYGRSIAVAASRGLCVLDLSRMCQLESGRSSQTPRWKLFRNVNDEHRFRVVSMVWWERENDDFLLAVVKYAAIDTLKLVCWSLKSVGFGSQLLLSPSTTNDYDANGGVSDYGVDLPPGFRVQSMSILRDPIDAVSSNQSSSSNRALLLLANVSCGEGAGCCVNYSLYQLQVISPRRKNELVLASNAARGSIPLQIGSSPDLSAIESVNGIFLAGGSFLFDLSKGVKDPGKEKLLTICYNAHMSIESKQLFDTKAPYDAIAMIGIMTIFQGLVAVCVNQTEPILYRPSLLSNTCEGCHFVVSYWMAGMISSINGTRIAWNIVQNDGSAYCWSVPCKNAHDSISRVQTGIIAGVEKHSILGEICGLGSSTLWMNGASTSDHEVAMGPFCSDFFASTLYAGQRSRMNSSTPSLVAPLTSFHVSNCIVAPPPFTPFLYVLFLTLSSESSSSDFEWQLVDHLGHNSTDRTCDEPNNNEVAMKNIKSILHGQMYGIGSTSTALRLITMKVLDILNASRSVSDHRIDSETTDHMSNDKVLLLQKWKLGKAVLSEIVAAVNEMYDALGFATFFLSVGRQLEPHQFHLIFPLPAISLTPNAMALHTSEDLFSLSCHCGSLVTAISALPLFSSHEESICMVTKLIYHCLAKIEENFLSCSSQTAITSDEDESYLHQLFWFGVKLEDAIEIEQTFQDVNHTFESNEDEHSFDSGQSSEDSSTDDYTFDTYSSEDSQDASFFSPCRSRHRKPRYGIIKRVTQTLLPSHPLKEDSKEVESQIDTEGNRSILSGFDDSPLAVNMVGGKVSNSNEMSPYDVLPSVAGAVCLFIGHAIIDGTNNANNHGWKAVSAVAHLLQGDRESVAITSACREIAMRISQNLTIEELVYIGSTATDIRCPLARGDSTKLASNILVKLSRNCIQQISPELVGSVFNLVLLLLLRCDVCQDVQLSRATLITVGIVSGHLSGRINELIDLSQSSDINDIYSLYADLVSETAERGL